MWSKDVRERGEKYICQEVMPVYWYERYEYMTILKYIMPSNHKSLIEANPWGCNVKKCLGWNARIKKGRDQEGKGYQINWWRGRSMGREAEMFGVMSGIALRPWTLLPSTWTMYRDIWFGSCRVSHWTKWYAYLSVRSCWLCVPTCSKIKSMRYLDIPYAARIQECVCNPIIRIM